MAEKAPQTYKNHARIDPLYHYFLLLVVAVTLVAAIWRMIQNPGLAAAWGIVVAFAVAVAALKLRLYALKAQDRVIRLEERLRLASLLSEPLKSRIGELSEAQLIALRFASDAEVAALVDKTLSNRLSPKQIKQAISQWRPDTFRI